MSKSCVSIIDYGLGNLFSVTRALQTSGASEIRIASSSEDILNAERLVIPGVGSFQDGMNGLERQGIAAAIREFASFGRPILGICLGMQLFATKGTEFGEHAGLDLIPGRVVRIPMTDKSGATLKSPFIGWSTLELHNSLNNRDNPIACLSPQDAVYLVHSYQYAPESETNILATYRYGDHNITAAIQSGNISGLQFHPEKSGKVGLKILSHFLETVV